MMGCVKGDQGQLLYEFNLNDAVLHRDFADCSALAEALSDQHAALSCLGTYTGAVPDAELRTITVDYTIEFAGVLRGSSPEAAFAFFSGSGAWSLLSKKPLPLRSRSL